MQHVKGLQENEKLKKEFLDIKIEFMRRGSSVSKFCSSNGLNRRHVFMAFNGLWNGKKAQALRERLTQASRGEQ
jgi:hypothetical protein